mgnify:CR=1 FL=1
MVENMISVWISLMEKIGDPPKAGFSQIKTCPPKEKVEDLYKIIPFDKTLPYNTYRIIDCLIDADSMEEYKADYGKTIITAYARISGWAVGIVAKLTFSLTLCRYSMSSYSRSS